MKLTKRVLHLKTKPIDFKYPLQNEQLAKEMLQFMHVSGGVGLAANQVGLRYRMFVMDVDHNPKVFFNPTIMSYSENKVPYLEGCLSYPNESVELDRPEKVVLSYQDAYGIFLTEEFMNLEARVVQHEVDHLDGMTMHDRKKENNNAE